MKRILTLEEIKLIKEHKVVEATIEGVWIKVTPEVFYDLIDAAEEANRLRKGV